MRGPLLLAAAAPPLFLYAGYQPGLPLVLGGADLDLTLADLAIAVVVAAAAVALARGGRGGARLRAAWPILAAAAALCLVGTLSLGVPRLLGEEYPLLTNATAVAKFCWYALLVPATVVLARSVRDTRPLARTIALWGCAAAGWGILQFAGVVAEFEGKRPGQREPSFVGIYDFGALSAAVFATGVVALAWPDGKLLGRRLATAALAGGALGIVLSGAMTAVVGLWAALVAVLVVARRAGALRRGAAMVTLSLALAATAGTALMRTDSITDFAAFLGLRDRVEDTRVDSYAHRTLLAYLGGRIFLSHPLTGVGWNGSREEWAYSPFLDDARRLFPAEPEEAFPSPERRWGVQNMYLQVAADLGLAGLAALVALGAAGLVAGFRAAAHSRAAMLGTGWLLAVGGVWLGNGLVAGIPMLALTFLALGLVTVR
ncbi:MAG: hypothetical protein EXQ77_01945 [Thermoleophilia bacterium]|nr:hypothetical protein [Thermoleophilia bacterium]